MRNCLFLSMILIAWSCSQDVTFTASDEESINQIRTDYVDGWVAGDREVVLGLFAKEATIIPSGLSPISGISSIEEYWFPNDSSVTTIHSYDIELLNLSGSDSMAYSLEKGALNFSYQKGDFSMTKISTSHATTIYKKNKEGNWKIISRMWTSLNN